VKVNQTLSDINERAAIILAGGEGIRLCEQTRNAAGVHVPKQFCPLLGDLPLLEQTRRRVSLSVPHDRVAIVLTREHERFFAPLLTDVSSQNLVIQPCNRGTAPAILYALLRLAEMTPVGVPVLLIASDHYVADERKLMKAVDLAFAAVKSQPKFVVLLGITPDEPETAYGWIEPGCPLEPRLEHLLKVRRFWEKPSAFYARELMAQGALWNSFMIVGRVPTLFWLFEQTLRDLFVSFTKIRPVLGTTFEADTVQRLYEHLHRFNFSRHVLEPSVANLCVLPVAGSGWSDVGDPTRLAKIRAALKFSVRGWLVRDQAQREPTTGVPFGRNAMHQTKHSADY